MEKLSLPKCPTQLLFWRATRGYIDSNEEFFEINESVSICIKSSEDVLTEL